MPAALNLGFAVAPRTSAVQDARKALAHVAMYPSSPVQVQVQPEDLNLAGYTHVNFAFDLFDPDTFQITPMDSNSATLYNRFTALKDNYSGLQTWISISGWSFTDPGPTRHAFSNMEYPGADGRGGVEADNANFVLPVQELKQSLGSKGRTMMLPTSYWYLQHFDVNAMQDYVDWFNLMSYDLHGTWDTDSQFVGPYIAPHTNLTEIDLCLGLLWRAGVDPSKVILGQGWYHGRSSTLKDPLCNKPNEVCEFSGGANAGPCSDAAGILDYQEISDVVSQYNLDITWDKTASVKLITWNDNQWVSYYDDDTFLQKKNSAKQSSADQAAKLTCYTTDCNTKCKKGTNQVAQMNVAAAPADNTEISAAMMEPPWVSVSGADTVEWDCHVSLAAQTTELVTDTNNHSGNKDQTCNGGLQSYCCSGFKTPPTKSQLKQKDADAGKDAAEAAAEQLGFDIAAKAFCLVAVLALLAPLELVEDLIPFISWILDAAEMAAIPELIQVCVKGIEKEGKAEFKAFGKERSLSIPTKTKPVSTRPPSSSHSSLPTSSANCKRVDGDNNCGRPQRNGPDIYESTASSPLRLFQPAVADLGYNRAYTIALCNGFIQERGVNCQAEEYPPATFWQGALSPKFDNQGNLPVQRVSDRVVGGLKRRVIHYSARTTRSAVRIEFDNDVVDPDGVMGLRVNPCWPGVLLEDPGFALLMDDPYYTRDRDAQRYGKANYPGLTPKDVLGNHVAQPAFRKRDEDAHALDTDAWVFNDGSCTRRATDVELEEVLGILRCSSADCHEEIQALGIDTALVMQPEATASPQVQTAIASTTQLAIGVVAAPVGGASAGSGAHEIFAQPRATGL
ncbi:hypothetical protein F5X99DRAFT_409340 [Biscogniauxia marginata]|nr:hypothetical protein F5X99DRAFT_409340 [Biscogniauxia marginata]